MSRKIFPSKYAAALFQCRSCPGVSPQRCLAPITAKSYPIFWRVWTCQAAQPHITIPASEKQKSTARHEPHRQDSSCLKVRLLRCLVAQWCYITVSACAIWVRGYLVVMIQPVWITEHIFVIAKRFYCCNEIGKGNFAIRHFFTLDDYQLWTISLNLTWGNSE